MRWQTTVRSFHKNCSVHSALWVMINAFSDRYFGSRFQNNSLRTRRFDAIVSLALLMETENCSQTRTSLVDVIRLFPILFSLLFVWYFHHRLQASKDIVGSREERWKWNVSLFAICNATYFMWFYDEKITNTSAMLTRTGPLVLCNIKTSMVYIFRGERENIEFPFG